MGLQIGDIVPRTAVTFEELKGKTIAVDAYNAIYQFLSSVRQPDGTPLMDSKKRVTSHLSGLFYRNVALMADGIKLIYVFDGQYHELKGKTHEQRLALKEAARAKYAEAREEANIDGMGKYAHGFTMLDKEMAEESKRLLNALGIAVVQAPGEGEMQCAQLVKEGSAWAVGSQDYDALAVGAPRLIQNLTLARKRKVGASYVFISPEILTLENVLQTLGMDLDQLISLAVLVGTDFNPGGVRGIGPKKALALVRERRYPVQIFAAVEGQMNFDWKEVFALFKEPNVHRGVKIEFPKIDNEMVKKILVEEHDFSEERIDSQLQKLKEAKGKSAQRTLF